MIAWILACGTADEAAVRRPPPSPAPAIDTDDASTPPEDTAGPCAAGAVWTGRVCMDRYEAPNVEGQTPFVMFSLLEAEAWCAAREKRLCTDAEWQHACEGDDLLAYPYGATWEPGRCNDEETWRVYDQGALNAWPSSASTPEVASYAEQLVLAAGPAADEIAALYQAEPAGENPGCAGVGGVRDLVGNVEEWTIRADGGATDFHGALKGRYWAESRTCQSTVTTHGDGFRFYEIGFRCCAAPG